VGTFLDRLLVQLSSAPEIKNLLAPASDANRDRLRVLVNAAYDLPFATLHGVPDVQVTKIELQRPLFPPGRTSGTCTQTTPAFKRTDFSYQSQDQLSPTWIDIVATVDIDLLLEVDPGQIESILIRDIENIANLNDFRSRFRFFDLDAFMAKHQLSTVEDLREAFQYLLAEIRLRALPPFDPNNPANRYRYPLPIAILIRETLELAAAMRDAKLMQAAAERSLTCNQIIHQAEVRTPLAPLVIFPGPLPQGGPIGETQIQTLFAQEKILALIVTLP
jgi:hypothetical protein